MTALGERWWALFTRKERWLGRSTTKFNQTRYIEESRRQSRMVPISNTQYARQYNRWNHDWEFEVYLKIENLLVLVCVGVEESELFTKAGAQ